MRGCSMVETPRRLAILDAIHQTCIRYKTPFLLIRGAFSMRTELCRDCGATHRYKTAGSWIAMAILILFAVCVVMGIMDINSEP